MVLKCSPSCIDAIFNTHLNFTGDPCVRVSLYSDWHPQIAFAIFINKSFNHHPVEENSGITKEHILTLLIKKSLNEFKLET